MPRHDAAMHAGRLSPEPPPTRVRSPKYNPEAWRSVGRAIAIALLDLHGANPASRIGPPGSDALPRLRAAVAATLQAQRTPREHEEEDGGGSDEADGAEDELEPCV